MDYADWEEKIKKKTNSENQDIRMLRKWFLIAFCEHKFTDEQLNAICTNLPDNDDLLKLFRLRRNEDMDFFNHLLDEALKSVVEAPKKEGSKDIIKTSPKKSPVDE